jgi:hypothetical protein
VNSKFQSNNYTSDLAAQGLKTPGGLKAGLRREPRRWWSAREGQAVVLFRRRWQSNESYQAGLWENKNAATRIEWDYDPDYSKARGAAADPEERQHPPHLAGDAQEQGVGVLRTPVPGVEQISATIAPESATKYDFPENEFITGSYTSPLTNRWLIDAKVSDIIQGWKDRYPPVAAAASSSPSRFPTCSRR